MEALPTTIVDIVMNELLCYGGEQKSRIDIQTELLAEGNDPRMVDFYLFSLSNHQPSKEELEKEQIV